MEQNNFLLIKRLLNIISIIAIIFCIIFVVLFITMLLSFSGQSKGHSYYDVMGPLFFILIALIGPIFITACAINYFTSLKKSKWTRWTIWLVVIGYIILIILFILNSLLTRYF